MINHLCVCLVPSGLSCLCVLSCFVLSRVSGMRCPLIVPSVLGNIPLTILMLPIVQIIVRSSYQ